MEEGFEKILNEQFENHTEQVDDQFVWEGIKARMEAKPKRRTIAWWTWSGLGVVLLLVLGGTFYMLKPIIEELPFASQSREIFTQNTKPQKLEQQSEDIDNHVLLTNIEKNSKASISQLRKSNVLVKNGIVDRIKTPIKQSSEIKKELISESRIGTAHRNENTRLVVENKKINDANSAFYSNVTTSVLDEKDEKIERRFNQKEIVENFKVEHQSSSVKALILPFFLESNGIARFNMPKGLVKNEQDHLRKFQMFSSLGLYSSIDFGGSSLSSTTLDSKYTDMISSNLALMEKVGLGVYIDVLKYKGWSISSGIGIEMLTDRFSWTGSYIEIRDEEYVESITEFIDGSRSEDIASGPLPWDVTKRINHYDNRYLITVPLMIGYELKTGNHRLGANTGLDFRYQNKHTSNVIDQLGTPAKYDMLGKWMSPSPRVSLNYGYYLNSNWSIGAELAVSRLRSKYAIDPLTSYIEYQMIGTRLSIRYDGF